jgi:hypothetical protein
MGVTPTTIKKVPIAPTNPKKTSPPPQEIEDMRGRGIKKEESFLRVLRGETNIKGIFITSKNTLIRYIYLFCMGYCLFIKKLMLKNNLVICTIFIYFYNQDFFPVCKCICSYAF